MRYSAGHIIAVALRALAIVLLLAAVPQVANRHFMSANNLDAAATASAAGDLTTHPLYSTYKFEKSPNVVNIGVQPLWLPVNIIVAAMKRDAVLGREMEKIGVKLRFYDFLKGTDLNFFLQRGDLHGGFSGDVPALTAASKMKIKIPALAQMGFTSIVSKQHYTINYLRGRRIGYAYGSNAHYALLNALAAEGMELKDVRLVPMEITDMQGALAADKIDAFSAWEPVVEKTLKAQPNARAIHRSLSSGYLYFTQDFCAGHPDALRAILAAEIRAVYWLQSDGNNLLRAAGWADDAEKSFSSGRQTPSDAGGRTPSDAGGQAPLSQKRTAALAANDFLGMDSEPRIPMRELSEGCLIYNEFRFLKEIRMIPQSAQWPSVRRSFDTAVMNEIIANPFKYRVSEYDYR